MSKTIYFKKNPHATDYNLYNTNRITLKKGINTLVGCNGLGKTTMMNNIKEKLEIANLPYMEYDNVHDGGSHAMSKAGFMGEINLLATLFCSSEGEGIISNLSNVAKSIGSFLRKNRDENAKEVFILLDAIDSGLSIDNICDVKDYLFKPIFEDIRNNSMDIYIVCAANSYELCRDTNCIDMYSCKSVQFKDYEDYKKYVLKSKKIKDERCES